MAIPFLNDVDITGVLKIVSGTNHTLEMEKNQIRNPVIHADSAAPSSPLQGQAYFDTTKTDTVNGNGKLGYRTTTKWVFPDMEKSVYDSDNDGSVENADEADTLDGQHGSYYLNRAYHTGSPSTDVSWANHKITNLADPTGDQDAANKRYVDGLVQGLSWKDAVLAATTANITLSNTQAIDGVSLPAGARVLVKNQTTASQNGIYIVVSGGAWTRALDANSWDELVSAAVFVEQGTTQADTAYVCTSNQAGTLNTDPVTWVQFGGSADITAGDGLSKTGNELDVNVDDQSIEISSDTLQAKLASTGALSKSASGMSVNVDNETIGKNASNQLEAKLNVGLDSTASGIDVQVDDDTISINGSNQLYVAATYTRKAAGVITPTTTSRTFTHNLGTTAVQVSVYNDSTGQQVYPEVSLSGENAVVLTFKETSSTDYMVVVVG
jgi:hypothetical protein